MSKRLLYPLNFFGGFFHFNKKEGIPIKKAKIGDTIVFWKKGIEFVGEVSIVRDNSVIATINFDEGLKVGIENGCTVINHKSYQIIR